LGTELSETAKKDKLDLSILSELFMALRMRLYVVFNAGNPEKVKELEAKHLTTRKMLTILLNPEMKELVRPVTLTLARLHEQRLRRCRSSARTSRTASKNTNVTIVCWHILHHASSAPWASIPSLHRFLLEAQQME
jgi:hypothetical protein